MRRSKRSTVPPCLRFYRKPPLVTAVTGGPSGHPGRLRSGTSRGNVAGRFQPLRPSLGESPGLFSHQCSFDKRTISPNARPVKWGMEEGKEPISAQHLEERAPHVVQVLKPDRGGQAEHGVLPILKDGDTPVPLQPVQHPAGVLAGEAGGNGAGRLIHPRHHRARRGRSPPAGPSSAGSGKPPGPVTRGPAGPDPPASQLGLHQGTDHVLPIVQLTKQGGENIRGLPAVIQGNIGAVQGSPAQLAQNAVGVGGGALLPVQRNGVQALLPADPALRLQPLPQGLSTQ